MKFKGRELNPLHIIALRLLCWPFIQVLRCALTVVIFIGWGREDAKEVWEFLS